MSFLTDDSLVNPPADESHIDRSAVTVSSIRPIIWFASAMISIGVLWNTLDNRLKGLEGNLNLLTVIVCSQQDIGRDSHCTTIQRSGNVR